MKLKSLCRELQRHNKMVIEESKKVTKHEQQSRQQLSKQFQKTLKDFTGKFEDQGKQSIKVQQENDL